ncbi:hypothetical protein ACFLS5_00890 [Candidatus Bipolaricaulota bacterium]
MRVEELAKTMLELFLAEMVLCTDRFQEPDVAFWSDTYDESGHSASELSREILAYRAAKQRFQKSPAGHPRNVVAVLIYNISHSSPRVSGKREYWEKQIEGGYTLGQITRVEDALDLVQRLRGACLSEQIVGRLVGRVVNLGRISRLIQEEYEMLEGGGIRGRE